MKGSLLFTIVHLEQQFYVVASWNTLELEYTVCCVQLLSSSCLVFSSVYNAACFAYASAILARLVHRVKKVGFNSLRTGYFLLVHFYRSIDHRRTQMLPMHNFFSSHYQMIKDMEHYKVIVEMEQHINWETRNLKCWNKNKTYAIKSTLLRQVCCPGRYEANSFCVGDRS